MNAMQLSNGPRSRLSVAFLRALACFTALFSGEILGQPSLRVVAVSPPANSILPLSAGPPAVSVTFDGDLATLSSGTNQIFAHTFLSAVEFSAPEITRRTLSARLLRRPLPGDVVEMTITTNVQALNGAHLEKPFVWRFREGSSSASGFYSKSASPVQGLEFSSLAAGDYNGDGRVDLIALEFHVDSLTGQYHLLLNSGTGFEDAGVKFEKFLGSDLILSADVNCDGNLDLLAAGAPSLDILQGAGNGGFSLTNEIGENYLTPIALTDVHGDGYLDLVCSQDIPQAWSVARLFINDGTGKFTPSSQALGLSGAVATGDVNRDGSIDVVGLSTDHTQVQIVLNDGRGNFDSAHRTSIPLDGAGEFIVLADFDNDGALDIVVGGSSFPKLLRNTGSGSFVDAGAALSHSFYIPYPGAPGQVGVSDINGDGYLDLYGTAIISDFTGDHIVNAVALNDGTGHFARWSLFSSNLDLDYEPRSGAVADFDGDDALDFAVGRYGDVEVWHNQAAGPSIIIWNRPRFGTPDDLIGQVVNLPRPDLYQVVTLIFVEGVGYVVKPTCVRPYVVPNPYDGTFTVDFTVPGTLDDRATIIELYLVPRWFQVPCIIGVDCPPDDLVQQAVATARLVRSNPDARRFEWSGQVWECKTNASPVGPGPLVYSSSTNSVFVDAQDRLHLRLLALPGGTLGAEAFSTNPIGFGRVTVVEEPPAFVAENVFMGAFAFNALNCAHNRAEFDIELIGSANGPQLGRGVQPADDPSNYHLEAFPITDGPSTQEVTWLPGKLSWRSWPGVSPDLGQVVEWTVEGDRVPPDTGPNWRFNVWTVNGTPPANGLDHEFVIRSFSFVPWQLTIERAGTDLLLKWPTWGGVLQSAPSLNGAWTVVPDQPMEANGFLQVRLDATSGARFFRLGL